MAVTVNLKNTFLTFEARECCKGSTKRSHSEGCRVGHECTSFQHLENIWCHTVFQQELKQQDVQVFQSDWIAPHQEATKSRPLGKIGQVSSLSSVSTMASSSEEEDCDSFRSSNSLSSMAWCDEDDQSSPLGHSRQSESCLDAHAVADLIADDMAQAAPKDSKHSLVPKNVNLAEGFAKSKKEGQAITTLMIRNIPNRCSQRDLIGELERVGFAGCFDFVYVPLDLGTMSNVGYAFVNFTLPVHAARCIEVLPKHQFSRQRKSGKLVAVSPAHMQGLEANLRHYETSAVNTSRLRQRRPVVMNILKTVSLASCI
jgi:hypothetical protein